LLFGVPLVISYFKFQKVANRLFCPRQDCLQILTRLAQNMHHKLFTKSVTNHLRNLYVIVFSYLIRAEFLLDNITSIFASILYIKMLQIVCFVQSDCLQILIRLDKNMHHKLSKKCVTNHLQNLYFIVLSKLISANFSFDTIPSVWQKLQYCKTKKMHSHLILYVFSGR
jgi:hypothetical protein